MLSRAVEKALQGRITVVIPSLPSRAEWLCRVLRSVDAQTLRPASARLVIDYEREGAAITRNRALEAVTTDWVAFLDDDDEFLPEHLAKLANHARVTGSDVVYSCCQVVGPLGQLIPLREEWGRCGQAFDPELLRQKSYLPVTCLARTDLAKRARFGAPEGSLYDDWGFYLRMLDLGARFAHLPETTWIWHHHGQNTSGQPDR